MPLAKKKRMASAYHGHGEYVDIPVERHGKYITWPWSVLPIVVSTHHGHGLVHAKPCRGDMVSIGRDHVARWPCRAGAWQGMAMAGTCHASGQGMVSTCHCQDKYLPCLPERGTVSIYQAMVGTSHACWHLGRGKHLRCHWRGMATYPRWPW